ncbi:MAG TPA: 4Fe-4S binding protein [Armatimonadota bacterium]|nr:4Fe-4S binding protein [Armatimonadota bacterium]
MTVKEQKEPGWKDLPIGGLIKKPGTSAEYETGDWRTERPVWDAEKCTSCLICWVYCPDSAIMLNEEGKMIGVDYEHCKGCGICAEECPPKNKAFTMVNEAEFRGK